MKLSSRYLQTAIFLGSCSLQAHAATGTWTNAATGGLWSGTGNWSGGIVADASGSNADFSTIDITADNTVHLDGPRTLTSLTFGDTGTGTAAGWILDNNSSATNILTLAGTTPTITVNALGTGKNVTISAVIAGSAGLTKAGAGTLILGAVNTLSGTLAVNAGELRLSGTGSIGSNPISIASGATFRESSTAAQTFGAISTISGTTAMFINNSASGTKTYSGSLSGFKGTMDFSSGGTFNLFNSSTLGSSDAAFILGASGDAGGIVLATGTYTVNLGSLTSTGATIRTQSSGSGGVVTLSIGGLNTDTTMAGALNQATSRLDLTKVGTGKLTLSASSNYTGITTLTGGTLSVSTIGNGGSSGNLGAATNVATNLVFDGGTLQYTGATASTNRNFTINAGKTATFDVTTNNLTVSGASGVTTGGLTKVGAGTLTLSGTNAYTGATTLSAGTLSAGLTANLGGSASNLVFDGGTLQITGTSLTNFSTIGHTVSFNATKGVGLDINNAGNTFTVDQVLNQTTGGFTKLGAGTAILNQANTFSGGTNINAGTLVIGATNTLLTTGAVTLNSSGSGSTPATLDVSNFSQTIGSLGVQNSNSTTADTITIGSGQTLTVNGAVTIGREADNVTTLANLTGAGTFAVSNSGGTFQVGGATSGVNDNFATLDMSGLSTFNANLGTGGTFRIGDVSAASDSAGGASTAIFAKTSTLTVGSLDVGGTTSHATTQTLKLGDTTNTINATTISVGAGTAGQRASGQILFNTSNGTLKIRSASDPVNGRADLNMINTNQGTSSVLSGTMDLTGHSSDVRLGTLTMAVRTGNSGASGSAAIFSFDTGTLDVTSIVLSTKTGGGTGTSTGTINIGGGTANIGSIAMASAASGQTANATINLTGGTTTLAGNITKTGGAGTTNAIINLDGGTLNMSGFSIGGANAVTLNAKSGTLSNLGQLNSGGVLDKTGGGILILGGTNTYTGATTITAGTLQIDGSTASGSTVGVGTAGTLSGSGTINGNATLTGGGVINQSSATIAGTLSVTGGNWNGAGSVTGAVTSSSGTFTIGSGANLTVNGGLNVTGGALAGTGTITGHVNYTSGSSSSYSGVIAGSGKTLTMNNSASTLTLTGINTYSGATTVTAGKLVVNGSIASSAVTVNSGGTLGGSGTVGALTVTSGGTVGPGNSPGILSSGNLDLQALSTYSAELNGTTAGTGYDQLNVTGSVNLGGGALSLSSTGYTAVNGDLLFILSNDSTDAITGTFSGLAQGSIVTVGGHDFEISYTGDITSNSFAGAGNDIALMAVPEPAPAVLGSVGLLLLLRRRRA